MGRVALVKGMVRYDNISNALEKVYSDIGKAVEKSYRIVVVPNFLYPKTEDTISNVDAMRALLGGITEFTNKPVTIAANSFSIEEVFSKFHWLQLQDNYSVKFAYLHDDEFEKKGSLSFSKTILESDCRISLGMLQTHDKLLANLSLSQFALGAMQFDERRRIMQDPKAVHNAVVEASGHVNPDFCVIDGFAGIQGSFPASTDVLEGMNVTLAGANCFDVDSIAASLMGLEPQKIAYLRENMASPRVSGERIASCAKKFLLPSNSKKLMRL